MTKFAGSYQESIRTLAALIGDTLGISRAIAEGVLRLAFHRDPEWFRKQPPYIRAPEAGAYTSLVVGMVLKTAATTYATTTQITARRLVDERRRP